MPSGKHKSRSLRRVFRRVPSGASRLFYRQRKHKRAHCGSCGAVLSGMPNAKRTKMRSMAKTKKRPQRPFGGSLCSKCMRRMIIAKAAKEK